MAVDLNQKGSILVLTFIDTAAVFIPRLVRCIATWFSPHPVKQGFLHLVVMKGKYSFWYSKQKNTNRVIISELVILIYSEREARDIPPVKHETPV